MGQGNRPCICGTPVKRKPAPTHRAAATPDEYAVLRAKVMERAKYRCENPWCRRAKSLQLAHVIARSAGGPDTESGANTVLLCEPCHRAQEDRRLLISVKVEDGMPKFSWEDCRPRKTGW